MSIFRIHFSPCKFKIFLQYWCASIPNPVIWSKLVECIDCFTIIGSLSPGGLVLDEVSTRSQKSRLVFANLCY